VGKPEGKELIAVGGRVILKWLFKKWGCRVCTGFVWLRIGHSGGLF